MRVSQSLPFFVALGLTHAIVVPSVALASATYYCNGGTCNGGGGNGDNGTGNGNNSGKNAISATGAASTLNVNVNAGSGYSAASGSANAASSLTASGTSGSSNSNERNVSIPVQLPSFSASGCGARPTFYGGLTGTPGNGGFGNSSNLGFGIGFLTAVGREPDSCKPPVITYVTNNYVDGTSARPAAPSHPTAPATVPQSFLATTVDAAPAFAPVPLAAQTACVPLDYDVAQYYAHDFRLAKRTADTARLDRDMRVLEDGCFHSLVLSSLAGR